MGKRIGWLLASALCSLLAAGPSGAGDAAAGKALHDARCLRCHGTEVYASSKQKITSLAALNKQVVRCAEAADANWDKTQTADVSAYLNATFYRFK
jgi:mono/diheme cytochrome c family protein